MLFSELNVHGLKSGLMKGVLMGECISVANFGPKKFEPIISVRLEDVVTLLVEILPALIVEINDINFILAG